jgi:hypothetical protein
MNFHLSKMTIGLAQEQCWMLIWMESARITFYINR